MDSSKPKQSETRRKTARIAAATAATASTAATDDATADNAATAPSGQLQELRRPAGMVIRPGQGDSAAAGAGDRPADSPPPPAGAESCPNPPAMADLDESDGSGEGPPGLSDRDESAADEFEELATPVTELDAGGIRPEQVVEAVLFASDEPVPARKLAEIVGVGDQRDIKRWIHGLNETYQRMQCAFRIESIAGGYQMLTQSEYNAWLKKLLKVRSESRLTPAALETLAIIAYKQPIMRVDVESVRGVGCGEMIRQLCEKQMVKIVGRAEELGRPLLYGTTKRFLEVFGLSSLKDLPRVEDLKPPD
ncbi:MAG: SMC-Scp complex subunit ScpB [Sedimentisphaerales bacterium]|nr:SMC-Scp complex subunit ScpB [Sedimentisphaerales bacterium]